MATPTETPRTTRGTTGMRFDDWPTGRKIAVLGGVLGLLMTIGILAGVAMEQLNVLNFQLVSDGMLAVVGGAGIAHLVLTVLVLVSVYLTLNNPRMHGGLLMVYGVVGLFVGFGFFLGAVLCIAGGYLVWRDAPGTELTGRRPAV